MHTTALCIVITGRDASGGIFVTFYQSIKPISSPPPRLSPIKGVNEISRNTNGHLNMVHGVLLKLELLRCKIIIAGHFG